MGSDSAKWKVETVIDLQKAGLLLVEDGNHGEYRPRPDEFGANGTSFIRAADMAGGRVLFESAQKITDVAKERIRKGIGASGDVILSHKGTVGKVAFVPLDSQNFVCSPQTTFWRTLDNDIIDRRYLFSFLNSHNFKDQLYSLANETDMAGYVSLTSQRGLKVTLPPISIQRSIAHILGSLDDKIELNRRMNATLEGMAQALFQSWFVDFDPVLDNALAAGNPIPDELADRAAVRRQALSNGTANRAAAKPFPAAFQLTEELGWIPEGWEVRKIADFADIKHGFAFKGEYFCEEKTEDILVTPGNFHIGGGFKGSKLKYYNGPVEDDYVLNDQDLIVTMTDLSKAGDTLGYPAFVPKGNNLRYLHNQRIGRILLKNAGVGKYFLNQIFRSEAYRNEILGSMTGSTVKHTSPSKILAFTLPFSGGALEEAIESKCEAIESRVSQNNQENITLAKLRDTLLPKLISGELRILDAEKLVVGSIG